MTTRPADGLLLVDKPAGVSSHDVVNAARRAFGERRIGHAGTLDPFATGLLVLMLGRATRLLPWLNGEPKEYVATVRFGAETDTEDLHGVEVRRAPLPAREAILAAMPGLTGDVDQVPPAYSAKRIDGQRAYALARAGEAPTLAAVRIRVHAWEPLAWRHGTDGTDDTDGTEGRAEGRAGGVVELDVRIRCGGGTYVRSLARDLARAAGSAAHLVGLRRTRSGDFDVRDAVTLDALRAGDAALRPALDAVRHLPVQALGVDDVARVVRGIDVGASVPGDRGALTHVETGALVAVAERRADRWQPRVVLREVPPA